MLYKLNCPESHRYFPLFLISFQQILNQNDCRKSQKENRTNKMLKSYYCWLKFQRSYRQHRIEEQNKPGNAWICWLLAARCSIISVDVSEQTVWWAQMGGRAEQRQCSQKEHRNRIVRRDHTDKDHLFEVFRPKEDEPEFLYALSITPSKWVRLLQSVDISSFLWRDTAPDQNWLPT